MTRTPVHALLMALVVACLIESSHALISFGYLSPQQAEKAGLEIRYRAAGPKDVWIAVSFPTDDKWKAFAEPSRINYVELAMDNEDETLGLRTTLREDRSTRGRVGVSFTVERTKLHQLSVWITRRITDVADVVRMKDFISVDEIDTHFKFVPSRPVEEESQETGKTDARAASRLDAHEVSEEATKTER